MKRKKTERESERARQRKTDKGTEGWRKRENERK